MLAYLRSVTLLAPALFAVVVADAGTHTGSFGGYARICAIRHTPCTFSFHGCGPASTPAFEALTVADSYCHTDSTRSS